MPWMNEPGELRAAFSVFYEDGEQYYSTTFFNETLVRTRRFRATWGG